MPTGSRSCGPGSPGCRTNVGGMALHLYSLTVDARDHRALARWWADVLGWRIGYEDEHECEVLPPEASEDPVDDTATWLARRSMLSFVPVPEGKTVKNRLHIDLAPHKSQDRDAEVAALLERGATHATRLPGSVSSVSGASARQMSAEW